nr:cystinosin [Hymenolepis microstoma]
MWRFSFDLIHTSITVYRLKSLITLQQLVGWTYFLAWTLSFYPQIILNFRRKSVEGLSLDLIVFNVLGFLCYSLFNVGLYCIPLFQEEYFKIYPLGVIPVQLNDLFFSLHALIITLVVVIQCFCYGRGLQDVSRLCKIITSCMLIFMAFSTLLAALNSITWLSALYLFSYVKLFVTLIKYVPQAVLNCRRRSCVGWSLGNVIFDFIGGIFSISQMFIIAYNCDDWGNVFGSPTKLGLGIVSVAFDIFFFVQHHVYRQPSVRILRESAREEEHEIGTALLIGEDFENATS